MSDLKDGIDSDQVREAFVVDLPASVAQSFEPQVREILKITNGDPEVLKAHKEIIQEKWVQHYTKQSGKWDQDHPELSALVQSRSQGRLQKRMGVGAQIAITVFATVGFLFFSVLLFEAAVKLSIPMDEAKKPKQIHPSEAGPVNLDSPSKPYVPSVVDEQSTSKGSSFWNKLFLNAAGVRL
jgi:hypothetical protein